MIRFVSVLIAVLMGLWVLLHLVQAILWRSKDRKPFVVGHRGAAGLAPENTMPAIETGIRYGAQAVEVDVHRTRDGTLVVMHDASIDRTTQGSGPIRALTWEGMRRLDAGRHFSTSYAGAKVPSLREVVERVLEAGRLLVVEVKDPDLYPGIASDLVGLFAENDSSVSEHSILERVVVISFDVDWLRRFHEVAPEVRLGQLHMWGGRWPKVGGTIAVDVYWQSVLLDPTLIWRARRRGYRCWVWTVNRSWAARLLWWLGVEAVTTDRPDLIQVPR